MSDPARWNKVTTASVNLDGDEARIEKLILPQNERELIRLSVWSQEKGTESPLTLTEKELITLLHRGIQAGILSPNFIGELRRAIEI